MANVYVEVRPKEQPGRFAITQYVIVDQANYVLSSHETLAEAVDWAEAKGHRPLVERMRGLNNKRVPDHWRAA